MHARKPITAFHRHFYAGSQPGDPGPGEAPKDGPKAVELAPAPLGRSEDRSSARRRSRER